MIAAWIQFKIAEMVTPNNFNTHVYKTQPRAENGKLPLMILLTASTVNAREMNKAKISSVDLNKIND